MKRVIAAGTAISLLLLSAPAAYAKPATDEANPGNSGKTITVPEHAIELAPGLYSLGEALDPGSGDIVTGYMIVRPYNGNKKPSGTPGGGGSDPASSCYGFLATGAKWKTLEPWVVNTTNSEGIDGNEMFSLLSGGVQKWEDAAAYNILGTGGVTATTLVADENAPDNVNEVYFGQLTPGTIGVTIVWGIFGGPTRNRRLVEWDQVYSTYYSWATDGNVTAMDFDSIATHELGHSVGLADLYSSSCSEQTMYGYGSEGETKARTLESGDIAGIQALY